jgi:hypothetical protein
MYSTHETMDQCGVRVGVAIILNLLRLPLHLHRTPDATAGPSGVSNPGIQRRAVYHSHRKKDEAAKQRESEALELLPLEFRVIFSQLAPTARTVVKVTLV